MRARHVTLRWIGVGALCLACDRACHVHRFASVHAYHVISFAELFDFRGFPFRLHRGVFRNMNGWVRLGSQNVYSKFEQFGSVWFAGFKV